VAALGGRLCHCLQRALTACGDRAVTAPSPYRTVQHRTVTVQYHTVTVPSPQSTVLSPYCTVPHRTAPSRHRTTPYSHRTVTTKHRAVTIQHRTAPYHHHMPPYHHHTAPYRTVPSPGSTEVCWAAVPGCGLPAWLHWAALGACAGCWGPLAAPSPAQHRTPPAGSRGIADGELSRCRGSLLWPWRLFLAPHRRSRGLHPGTPRVLSTPGLGV